MEAIGGVLAILAMGIAGAYAWSKNKSWKQKNVIWGLAAMLIIAPFLSWLIGVQYGILVGDGFAGGGLMVILFVIIFVFGLIAVLVGIFGNEEKHRAKFK
ncbi:hypothetical protein [Planomicrobium sp. CPCC 101079]|uniref:hypothetical protein n=1 Tax=Planomicrobium sp. CPCC 101079 TaxID=2599618 RepID=UPI0011B6A7D5|nr:hypothetical protein [Planomicrobium sp. CPCC 101079]TWT02530.1 hypothetical protein FQV28_13900 [Planomicrobium sp. CPCC 101079]